MKTLLCFFILVSSAAAQCLGPTCPIPYHQNRPDYNQTGPNYSQKAPNYSKSPPGACQISNRMQKNMYLGTGILVAKNNNTGIILTVAHIFKELGKITVTFPGGKTYVARVELVDAKWDLAALVIARPDAEPVKFSDKDPRVGDRVFAGGFGGNGRWAWVPGPIKGYVSPSTAPEAKWIAWNGSAREGDSGGPVVNKAGQIVGIVSGVARDNTFSTGPFLGLIKTFLRKVFGRLIRRQRPRPAPVPAPRQSPQQDPIPPAKSPAASSEEPKIKVGPPEKKSPAKPEKKAEEDLRNISVDRIAAEVAKRIKDKIPAAAGVITKKPGPVKAGFWALFGKAFGVSAVTAAGVTTGGAGSVAASLLFWYMGRRRKRKGKGAAGIPAAPFHPPAVAPAPPELHPRDETEAREILQLSQLEGRSPVLDGLIGRLTLDGLQEIIDGQDKTKAAFAHQFRTGLVDQVNNMVPLSV